MKVLNILMQLRKIDLVELIVRKEIKECTDALNSPHFTLHELTRKEKTERREELKKCLVDIKEMK